MRLNYGAYWGLVILTSLFYWRTNHGLRLTDTKTLFVGFAGLASLLFYGISPIPPRVKVPVAVVLSIAFFKIYNAASLMALSQWFMITVGGLVFLQAFGRMGAGEQRHFKRYLSLSCMALSMSVLACAIDLRLGAPYDLGHVVLGGKVMETEKVLGKVLPGALGNQGFSAMFIALTLSFMGASPWGYLMGLTALGAIAYVGTATPLLAAIGGMALTLAWNKSRRALMGVLAFLGASVGALMKWTDLIPDLQNMGGRGEMWKVVASAVLRAPFFGYGPGVFRDAMVKSPMKGTSGRSWDYVCNEYLEGALIFGGVGMAAIIFLVFLASKSQRRRIDHWGTSAVILAILSLTWFPFHIASTSFVAIIVFAILIKNGGSLCGDCLRP